MAFRYFGGKKALARHYPPPQHDIIIEPFAGSAGYSLYWAKPDTTVWLRDKDERIVELWRRLQRMSLDELLSLECPPLGARCTDPLINLTSASENTMRSRRFHDAQVTARMVEKWPSSRTYIASKLDLIRNWVIQDGSYDRMANLTATWFIDPPYQPLPGQRPGSRGDGYRKDCNSRQINYRHLGEWCKSRRGQAIVCDHIGADWLPFVPFRSARTTQPGPGMRTEAIWIQPAVALV